MTVFRIEVVFDWRVIGAILFGLVMFGVAFNDWVGRIGEHKEGYTAMLVAMGVSVTLAGVAVVSWTAALICLAAFMASGLPMIFGDVARHVQKRKAAIERMRGETYPRPFPKGREE